MTEFFKKPALNTIIKCCVTKEATYEQFCLGKLSVFKVTVEKFSLQFRFNFLSSGRRRHLASVSYFTVNFVINQS